MCSIYSSILGVSPVTRKSPTVWERTEGSQGPCRIEVTLVRIESSRIPTVDSHPPYVREMDRQTLLGTPGCSLVP